MISNLLKMLSYPFMQRALVVGILVSLCVPHCLASASY